MEEKKTGQSSHGGNNGLNYETPKNVSMGAASAHPDLQGTQSPTNNHQDNKPTEDNKGETMADGKAKVGMIDSSERTFFEDILDQGSIRTAAFSAGGHSDPEKPEDDPPGTT